MIKFMICRFTKNCNLFSLLDHNWCDMSYLQRKTLPKIKFRVTSVTLLVQKTSNVLTNLQNQSPQQFLNWNLNKPMHTLQETSIALLLLKLDTTSSKIISFFLQSLNGTIQILPFQTKKVLVISKIVSLSLLDPLQAVFLVVIIMKVLDLSHLRENKFKQNFRNYLNAICSCRLDIEQSSHFVLRWPIFKDEVYIPELSNSYL